MLNNKLSYNNCIEVEFDDVLINWGRNERKNSVIFGFNILIIMFCINIFLLFLMFLFIFNVLFLCYIESNDWIFK